MGNGARQTDAYPPLGGGGGRSEASPFFHRENTVHGLGGARARAGDGAPTPGTYLNSGDLDTVRMYYLHGVSADT